MPPPEARPHEVRAFAHVVCACRYSGASHGFVAQWIERLSPEQKVVGSNPIKPTEQAVAPVLRDGSGEMCGWGITGIPTIHDYCQSAMPGGNLKKSRNWFSGKRYRDDVPKISAVGALAACHARRLAVFPRVSRPACGYARLAIEGFWRQWGLPSDSRIRAPAGI